LQERDLAVTRSEHMMSFTVPDNGKGLDVELR